MTDEATRPNFWTFRTKRFEIRYWKTKFLAVAEINSIPKKLWPLTVAVDVGIKKSRPTLVREAVNRLTDRIVSREIERK